METLLNPTVLQQLASLAGLVLGALLLRRLKTPNDRERAQLLAALARDAAAIMIARNPNARWPELVRLVANAIGTKITDNREVIERAAAGALMDRGQRPNG